MSAAAVPFLPLRSEGEGSHEHHPNGRRGGGGVGGEDDHEEVGEMEAEAPGGPGSPPPQPVNGNPQQLLAQRPPSIPASSEEVAQLRALLASHSQRQSIILAELAGIRQQMGLPAAPHVPGGASSPLLHVPLSYGDAPVAAAFAMSSAPNAPLLSSCAVPGCRAAATRTCESYTRPSDCCGMYCAQQAVYCDKVSTHVGTRHAVADWLALFLIRLRFRAVFHAQRLCLDHGLYSFAVYGGSAKVIACPQHVQREPNCVIL